MKKIIKKFGNSIGVSFDKDEKKIYSLEVDDVIEIDIIQEE